MLPILQFIFSSFWVWAGFAILLATVTEGVSRIVMVALAAIGNARS